MPELIAARPTIKLNDQRNTDLESRLISLDIVEQINNIFRCELTLSNYGAKDGQAADYLYFDRQVLDFNKTLEITYKEKRLFKGKITGLEGRFPSGAAGELSVLAEDALQKMRMNRRTRTFTDMKDSDVISKIGQEYGLQVQVDSSSIQHKALVQMNQSDLDFVLERARFIDCEVWADDKNLTVQSRGKAASSDVKLTYSGSLTEFTALADLSAQRESVTVRSYDVENKEAIAETASESVIQSEIGSLKGSKSLLNGSTKEELVHTAMVSGSAARQRAETFYRTSSRRFVTGRGVAEPTPTLHAGRKITLAGLGDLFNGNYYVTEARHLFDNENGMRSEFAVERPGIGG